MVLICLFFFVLKKKTEVFMRVDAYWRSYILSTKEDSNTNKHLKEKKMPALVISSTKKLTKSR